MKIPHLGWPGSVRLAPAWHHATPSTDSSQSGENSYRLPMIFQSCRTDLPTLCRNDPSRLDRGRT